MATLAKHFGHKVPVDVNETRAAIRFESGAAHIEVKDNGLILESRGETVEAAQIISDVVERHLLRFAFRESPVKIDWQRSE